MVSRASTAPRTLADIALLVAATAFFAVLDTSKFVCLSLSVLMALRFRYAFQAIATTLAVLPKRSSTLPKTAHPKFQCLRGVLLLTTSVLHAPMSILMPFLYAQIGFAMLGGWLVFSHVPDQWSLLGISLIAVCGAAGAWLAVRGSRGSFQTPKSSG